MTRFEWTADVTRIPHGSLLRLMEEATNGDDDGNNYLQGSGKDIEALFGPGITGFFALKGSDLVAFARVMSDDFLCSWLAEICVHPDWRGQGIGRELVERIRDRFGHTATYVHAPVSKLDFFMKCGLLRKKKLIAACCIPNNSQGGEVGADMPSGISILNDISTISGKALAELYDSVGFGIRNATHSEILHGCFGPGIHGEFAFAQDRLVGLARIFSDGVASSWVAELCVHPEWQRVGIGRALLTSAQQRFAHTRIYGEAFSNQQEFFKNLQFPPREKWIALSISRIRSQATL